MALTSNTGGEGSNVMHFFRRIGIMSISIVYCCTAPAVCADEFLYYHWEEIVKTCVEDGSINYAVLYEKRHILSLFLNDVANLSYDVYLKWPRSEKCAFWINVYNAWSVSLILDNPYARTVHELRTSPDEKQFRALEKLFSLNEIRHMYLRGLILDERVHFSLAGPARGFPRLRNEAYVSSSLDFFLEDDVKRFLSNKQYCDIQPGEKKIVLSSLFKWFGVDFIRRYENERDGIMKFNARERAVLLFLSTYFPEHNNFLLGGDFTIEYRPFDWTINRVHIP